MSLNFIFVCLVVPQRQSTADAEEEEFLPRDHSPPIERHQEITETSEDSMDEFDLRGKLHLKGWSNQFTLSLSSVDSLFLSRNVYSVKCNFKLLSFFVLNKKFIPLRFLYRESLLHMRVDHSKSLNLGIQKRKPKFFC